MFVLRFTHGLVLLAFFFFFSWPVADPFYCSILSTFKLRFTVTVQNNQIGVPG
jgi:hypothetical protein